MAGGTWEPTSLPTRPGLYINFIEAAAAQISGGARGTVAIPLLVYANTATAKTLYTVTTEKEAVDLFGAPNVKSILFALQGGAKEVLVYAMPTAPAASDYTDMRAAFDAYPFNVFVLDGEYNVAQHAAIKTWVAANRTAGKHFVVVIGGDVTTDATSTTGDTRSTLNSDDYIVNLINGVVIAGVSYTSSAFAPWLAGLIAGTAINRSITYTVAPVDDVTKRLTGAQVTTSLAAGSLVLVNDGEKVKLVQGIVTSRKKIRSIRARQAVATDVRDTSEDNYIGKLNNNADGQAALMVAIKAYLESLEADGVLSAPIVVLDPQRPSVGDSVFLAISYAEIDSIERIFLTVNI
jgi:hypothetical protein